MKKALMLDWDLKLPDFASPAVLLRAGFMVNLCLLVGAILRQERGWAPYDTFISAASLGEPALLLTMLVLAASWRRAGPKLRSALALFTGAAAVGVVALFHPEPTLRGTLSAMVNALIVSVLLCMYFDWRYRRLSPALAEAKLEALLSRMRPHFLFNAINGIVMLLNKSPEAAEEALLDLADVFRASLKDGGGQSKLGDEIDLTQKYLRIEKMRFDDRMKVTVNCDPRCLDALIPTMLLQPLVENAVIHGIETMGAGSIEIKAFAKDDRLFLLIENPFNPNAAGRTLRKSNGMAMDNIKQRLALIYDMDATFASGCKEPGVWRVSVHMPLNKAPQRLSR